MRSSINHLKNTPSVTNSRQTRIDTSIVLIRLIRFNIVIFFTLNEVKETVDSCPNGRRCGSDVIFYEDLKKMFEEHGDAFVNILNVILINKCIPCIAVKKLY